jgi:hypothetical protein
MAYEEVGKFVKLNQYHVEPVRVAVNLNLMIPVA